jgi:polyribonucleotide nucleotidyltransferase
VLEELKDFEDRKNDILYIINKREKEIFRRKYLEEKKRLDGRAFCDIREITCEVGLLPRTHGSSLFTRGETQSLVVTTLGTKMDEKIMDELEGEYKKSYMLHYNFPPFSVGEIRAYRGPGRREIGHGLLAERAILPIIPGEEEFPYTIRIVSDILESNGSSSMATVCGGTLSLMDAGIPIKSPVAGIAMGLITGGAGKEIILSDIIGAEDHLGDMDFKVTGTKEGITAFQLDTKTTGLGIELLEKALEQAKQGRIFILDVMSKTLEYPREDLSVYAPRIITLTVNKDKIRDVIGPQGKMIKKITEETGAVIDIEDSGKITIASVDPSKGERALEIIKSLTDEVEVGKIYKGEVKKITSFGAFVEVLPGHEGLIHISQIDFYRVKRVEDVLKEGDKVMVKVIGIDNQGRINLSRKEALKEDKKTLQRTQ